MHVVSTHIRDMALSSTVCDLQLGIKALGRLFYVSSTCLLVNLLLNLKLQDSDACCPLSIVHYIHYHNALQRVTIRRYIFNCHGEENIADIR
jgi:hypothetical protein